MKKEKFSFICRHSNQLMKGLRRNDDATKY